MTTCTAPFWNIQQQHWRLYVSYTAPVCISFCEPPLCIIFHLFCCYLNLHPFYFVISFILLKLVFVFSPVIQVIFPWSFSYTKHRLKSKKYFHLNPLFRVVRAPRSHDGVQFEQTFYVKQITKNMMMVIIITQKRKIPGRSITPPLHRIFILSLSAQQFKGAGLINQVSAGRI